MDQDPTRCRFCGEVAGFLVHEASVLVEYGFSPTYTKFPPACADCQTCIRVLISIRFRIETWNPAFINYTMLPGAWVAAERLGDLHSLRWHLSPAERGKKLGE